MRYATWNVNSVRARSERICDFLRRENIDALAIQETKCRDDQFPEEIFQDLGYEVAHWGINQWNGVAIISRCGIEDIERGFPHQPLFRDVKEPRALAATCGGIRIWSLYIPNGRELSDPHYTYKLEWMHRLAEYTHETLTRTPALPLMLMGDWNVAPRDSDVWDMAAFDGKTHVSVPEREAFAAFAAIGMHEVTRDWADNYTYWDYKRLRFPKNHGMRIDFVYASATARERVRGAEIVREERKGKGASDHVPVIVDIE